MTDRQQKHQRQKHLDLWFQSAQTDAVEAMCKLLQSKQVTDADVQD